MMALECSGVMTYARGDRSCARTGFHEEAAIAIEHTSMRAGSGLISCLCASAENMRPLPAAFSGAGKRTISLP